MKYHLKQLTWLRGIAAFLVICSHTLRAVNVSYYKDDAIQSLWLHQFFALGTFGVLLFFILSGCTLFLSYETKINSLGHTFAFYIKRFFRIWPAFLVSFLVYSCFRLVFQQYYPEPMGYWIEPQYLTSIASYNYLTYPTLSFNFFGDMGLFNNAYWSLPVEFQYYLLFPVILLSLRYLSVFGPILIGLILYAMPKFMDFPALIDTKFFLLAYSFCGGMLIGYIYTRTMKGRFINKYITLIVTVLIFVSVSFVTNDWYDLPDIVFVSNKWNFYALSGLLLTMVLLCTKIELPKFLDTFLSFLGEVSYSTYLYHNVFIAIAVLLVINFHLTEYKLFLVFSFATLFTYVLSYYSYKYVEKSGIKLGKRYAGHFS